MRRDSALQGPFTCPVTRPEVFTQSSLFVTE